MQFSKFSVNSFVYYAYQTHEICKILPYTVDLKAPGSFEIHWVREYLKNIDLFRIQDLYPSEMGVKF